MIETFKADGGVDREQHREKSGQGRGAKRGHARDRKDNKGEKVKNVEEV